MTSMTSMTSLLETFEKRFASLPGPGHTLHASWQSKASTAMGLFVQRSELD